MGRDTGISYISTTCKCDTKEKRRNSSDRKMEKSLDVWMLVWIFSIPSLESQLHHQQESMQQFHQGSKVSDPVSSPRGQGSFVPVRYGHGHRGHSVDHRQGTSSVLTAYYPEMYDTLQQR